MDKKVELLAPVGGLKQFFAAVENGADAVYIGGYKYSARMKADNFTTEQLTEAIRYAHLRNVKVYITVNTLLTDSELPSAAEYCIELFNMGADALIVQDLGLAAWVRENLPDFPLHLSTQGTVYNPSGVKAAEFLGFSRVVLARETSLYEIKKITESSDMEIEIFVHGALCMCYSGQCQMSRVIGGINGRSGNRGLCAQPCRLPYTVLNSNDQREDKQNKNRNNPSVYPLSPRDLCTLDYLGEILDAGVTSLKIEGRMKSPEYVAIVTRIYRKYLDEYLRTGTYTVSKEDRDALSQIYSRGSFTAGYLFENPGDKLITKDLPKHHGVYIGKIVNVLRGKNLIDIELSLPLSIGDGIEIRNKELTGNMVTYLKEIGKNSVRVGDIKGHVEVGQKVYRITQDSLMKQARKTYEGADFAEGKSYKRVPIDLNLTLKIEQNPTLRVIEGHNEFTYTDKNVLVELATNKPLEESLAERQLRKTGSTCFDVKNVHIVMEKESSLPISALNKLRREALNAYSDYKISLSIPINSNEKFKNQSIKTDISSGDDLEKQLAFYVFDSRKISEYDFSSEMDYLDVVSANLYLPLQDFMNGIEIPDMLKPVPYISNVSKGNLDKYIESNFIEIVDAVRQTGIAIGNLGWCLEFANEGVTVFADYGLNLYNEKAKDAIKALGVIPTYMSLESQNEGAWPIMITEHPLPSAGLIDRKKQNYHVVKTPSGDKWQLFKSSSNVNRKTLSEHLSERWKNTSGELRIYI